jgi:hypothetical protein
MEPRYGGAVLLLVFGLAVLALVRVGWRGLDLGTPAPGILGKNAFRPRAAYRVPVHREKVYDKLVDTCAINYPGDTGAVAEFADPADAAQSPEWHLLNSTAAHGTHPLVDADGRTQLEGRSAFKELAGTTDDRIARVRGAHQRRAARTRTKATTANAMAMFMPHIEPGLSKAQRRDWWENANTFNN